MSDPTGEGLDALVARLRSAPHPVAPASLRARLRAEILTAPVPAWRRGWREAFAVALRPALAAALVTALIAGGAGAAAASSLPGDPAYGLKRALEEVSVLVAADDARRVDTLVAQSEGRLAELRKALESRADAVPRAAAEYVAAQTRLKMLVDEARAGAPAGPSEAIDRATAETAKHVEILEEIAERAPAPAQDGLQRAIDAARDLQGPQTAPGIDRRPTAPPGRTESSPRR